jgi:hypothetical protein
VWPVSGGKASARDRKIARKTWGITRFVFLGDATGRFAVEYFYLLQQQLIFWVRYTMNKQFGNLVWLVISLMIVAFAFGIACKSISPSTVSKAAKAAGVDDKIPYAKEVADVCNFRTEHKCTKKSYDKCVQDLGKQVAKKGKKFKKGLKCRAKCANKADNCKSYNSCANKC